MIDFKNVIAEALVGIPEVSKDFTQNEIKRMIEIPADETMGDFAFPCFKLAKTFRKAPPMISDDLALKLRNNEEFEKLNSINGYLNFFMKKDTVANEVINTVRAEEEDYGSSDLGRGRKVVVEFSSPNIAKPFHIGHIRSTVIGNAINNIYDFLGYDTVRINHLGDYGTQFGKMIVAYERWGSREEIEKAPIQTLLKYYTKFHEESEKDPSLEDEAREAFTNLENGSEKETELWQWFRDESLKEFGRVYKMLGIEFDSYAGESFYSDKMNRVIDMLIEKGLLVESDGAKIVDLSEYDMPPALIQKKDGSTLYITRDIAAAIFRKEHYGFYKNLYIVASQQNLHFQQWIKIIELLGYDWAHDCVHIPFGLVSLEDGTMSTRSGRVVFLEDVLLQAVNKTKEIIEEKGFSTDNTEETAESVGIGAVIFQELSNNRIKDYVFSWDKVLNFDGETGPYVQYSHARACSVLRKADEEDIKKISSADFAIDPQYVSSDSAYSLIKLIYRFPQIIEEAGEKYEPSILTRHIVNIAQAFNRFYHDEYVLVDNKDERDAKLALVFAAKTVIKNGLNLLGIKAPERM